MNDVEPKVILTGKPGEPGKPGVNGGGDGGTGGRGGQGVQGKQGKSAPKRAMFGYAILAVALILMSFYAYNNRDRINRICHNIPSACHSK